MRILGSIGHAFRSGLGRLVTGLMTGLDGLTAVVARLSDRVEAHLAQRTTRLRAYYRRDQPQPLDLPFTQL